MITPTTRDNNDNNNNRSITTERTEILYGEENVMNTILQFLSKANRIDSCGDSKAPSIAFEVKEYSKLLFDLKNRGIKLRYITDITKENIFYCKQLIQFAEEIRHLDGIKANFSISETEYIASSTTLQETLPPLPVPQVIYSNVKDIVGQQKYVFESFWNKAIPAEQRIKEIEGGVILGKTEVIQSPSEIQELFINLVKSAKQEILLILPTTNSFLREHSIGILQLLKQAATERSIKVKFLTPTNDIINKIMVQDMSLLGDKEKKNFDIRFIDPTIITTTYQTPATTVNTVSIVVVDKKESLVIEKKDDLRENFIEAVGSATYSISQPTVLSYVSIFDIVWNQVKLYEQLKLQDKMQNEFINIASHEMKTPTQAVLAYSELLQRHPEKREEMIQAIYRNAIRLQKLTDDILDVTKIESQTLKLHKEKFNLSNLLSILVEEYRNNIQKKSNSSGNLLLYNNFDEKDLFVEADKGRITQVISNLLANASKFTKEEGISITTRSKDSEEVIVSVKDSGTGIDPEILPRLFSKFATKSETGTGLGLFICKAIVEAHGGRIWAENNNDDKGKRAGAIFAFSLPISKQQPTTTLMSEGDKVNQ